MNRLYIVTLFLLVSLSLSAQKSRELLILHTNDTHSRIEPVAENNPDTIIAGRGGVVRRAALIDSIRRENADMLLFDSGDFSQGSPFYNMFKGEVEITMMNKMGYNAATIGNHEFDFGIENMARIFKMANFPIVNANYDFTGTPLEGIVKPYIIIKRNGLKIGVFGLGPRMKGLIQDKCYAGAKFNDPIIKAQQTADYLKNSEKCDVVICLSHLGWQGSGYSDETLIPNTRNIDLVLGGHSHSFFDSPKFYKNLDGKMIPLQQMGKHAAYVGKIKLELKKK